MRSARDARPPGGPNYFIFKKFSANNLQNNPNLGVGAPAKKILDPPLDYDRYHIKITFVNW